MVTVLTLLYINSFLDRTVISLVIDPIKEDFGVSDTAVSLLSGLAFALFYSVLGIPMGWLADRRSRRWIIGLGATGWAIMASLGGIAQNYTQLFLARVGLGVGEATFMPSAFSMISDYFPRDRFARAYAVLMLGAPLGAGVAFVVGGLVASYAESVGTVQLPVLGEIRSWQLVFLITGLPGIVLALWVLIFFLTFPQGTNVAAFQLITPNQMRAQVSAVFLLVTNVFGLGLGATMVALLTDYVFGAPALVNYSLALASVLVGVPALVCLILGLKPYRQSLKEADRWLSSAARTDS